MPDYKNYNDDEVRYKKKSNSRPPKKANHKHLCEPCIISYPNEWWAKEHLRTDKTHDVIGIYCPICGKIGELKDRARWYMKDTVFVGNVQFTENVLTEEGKKEMNPETRTLPTFKVKDPFDKFVVLVGEEENL